MAEGLQQVPRGSYRGGPDEAAPFGTSGIGHRTPSALAVGARRSIKKKAALGRPLAAMVAVDERRRLWRRALRRVGFAEQPCLPQLLEVAHGGRVRCARDEGDSGAVGLHGGDEVDQPSLGRVQRSVEWRGAGTGTDTGTETGKETVAETRAETGTETGACKHGYRDVYREARTGTRTETCTPPRPLRPLLL